MEEQYIPQEEVTGKELGDRLYTSQMQEERTTNIVKQISPDSHLLELQWRIRGYIKDPVNGQWKKLVEDAPEPHTLLVSRYISTLSSFLNQNTTLTNLSIFEINNLMKLLIEWVSDDLDCNQDVYEMKGEYSEMTRIAHLMLGTTFFVLKRAQNGMESKRIFDAINIKQSLTENNNPNKDFADSLKFWK